MKTIRYCYVCGHLGPLTNGFTACCSEEIDPVEIPEELAKQAKAGFSLFSFITAIGQNRPKISREWK